MLRKHRVRPRQGPLYLGSYTFVRLRESDVKVATVETSIFWRHANRATR